MSIRLLNCAAARGWIGTIVRLAQPRGSIVACAILVLTSASCVSAADDALKPHSDGIEVVSSGSFVSLTRTVVPPPAEPPILFVIGDGSDHDISASATYYDWHDVSPGLVAAIPVSGDWPEPVPRSGRRDIMIESAARPIWVTAYVFSEIDPETGWPVRATAGDTNQPLYDYRVDCEGWTGSNACPPVSDGVWSMEVFGDNELKTEYVTVNVTWRPPWREVDGTWMAGEVRASYSLHFAND